MISKIFFVGALLSVLTLCVNSAVLVPSNPHIASTATSIQSTASTPEISTKPVITEILKAPVLNVPVQEETTSKKTNGIFNDISRSSDLPTTVLNPKSQSNSLDSKRFENTKKVSPLVATPHQVQLPLPSSTKKQEILTLLPGHVQQDIYSTPEALRTVVSNPAVAINAPQRIRQFDSTYKTPFHSDIWFNQPSQRHYPGIPYTRSALPATTFNRDFTARNNFLRAHWSTGERSGLWAPTTVRGRLEGGIGEQPEGRCWYSDPYYYYDSYDPFYYY